MSITYEKLIRLLKANLLIIIAAAILCFGVTYAYMKFIVPPVYSSTAKFFVESKKQSTGLSLGEINADRAIVETYLAILDSDDFYEEVHNALSEDVQRRYTPQAIRNRTKIDSVKSTEVLSVSFRSEESEFCKVMTDTIVRTVGEFISEKISDCSVSIIQRAGEPSVSSDQTKVASVVMMLIGAALVFVIVLIRDIVDIRIRTVEDLTDKYNIPILGVVPAFKGKVIKGGKDND